MGGGGSELHKVKYLVATLPYSNVYFAKAYRIERLESLLDGLVEAKSQDRLTPSAGEG